MPARKWYRWTIEGFGAFPIDMLRYDCCFPERESEDSYVIGQSHYPGLDERWTVRVLSHKPQPTLRRWESFLCRVTKVEVL